MVGSGVDVKGRVVGFAVRPKNFAELRSKVASKKSV